MADIFVGQDRVYPYLDKESITQRLSLHLAVSADMSGKEDGRPNGGGGKPTPTQECAGDMGNAGGGISGTGPNQPEVSKPSS